MARFPQTTFEGAPCSDDVFPARLPADLMSLLRRSNGLVAYRGGLHIRGVGKQPPWHSLENSWHGPQALHLLYPSVRSTDLPFGQDCLGDQFLLREESVWKLSAETGEIDDLDMTLSRFLDLALDDPVDFLGLQPLIRFEQEGGTLLPGELLSAYPPFVFEESKDGISLAKAPALERILFLANLARQIASIQNGEQVKIEFDM